MISSNLHFEHLFLRKKLYVNVDIPFAVYIFIGGYDTFGDDTFYWLDGTAVEDGYTNFEENQVDGGPDDAMFMDDSFDWQWGDFEPNDPQPFLCERDVPQM